MSKQSEAKYLQGYVDKAEPRVCMTCAQYRSVIVKANRHGYGGYSEEKNKHCGVGGFSVKKMGTCDLWEAIF